MGARRRAGPAAVAAALIGAGLALHRPRLVTELRPGPRLAPPPSSAGESALSTVRPAAPRPAPSSPGPGGAASPRRPDAAFEEAALRDAPADHQDLPGDRAASAPGGYFFSARQERELRAAPSAAETDPLQSLASVRIPTLKERAASAASGSRPSPLAGAARPRARGTPLFSGPAAADDSEDLAEEDGSSAAARPENPAGASAWARRRTRAFPLFRPPRREAERPKPASSRRRVRPLLLSKLLGPGALRPPPASIVPPDLRRLKERKPPLLSDGSPAPALPYELSLLETLAPPGAAAACRRRAGHWDAGPLWHDGPARGVSAGSRWLWLWKEDARWWAAREPERPPLLHHQGRWWNKQRGVWFALHDGELWSWRIFSDWDAEGLLRLTDGVELVYSADFTKVAVITPGEGAVLYDAATGAELGEWLEGELPPRRPRPPAGLRLPRGI